MFPCYGSDYGATSMRIALFAYGTISPEISVEDNSIRTIGWYFATINSDDLANIYVKSFTDRLVPRFGHVAFWG